MVNHYGRPRVGLHAWTVIKFQIVYVPNLIYVGGHGIPDPPCDESQLIRLGPCDVLVVGPDLSLIGGFSYSIYFNGTLFFNPTENVLCDLLPSYKLYILWYINPFHIFSNTSKKTSPSTNFRNVNKVFSSSISRFVLLLQGM